MLGRGLGGNNVFSLALCQLSVTSSTTHKEIGPFWCLFQDGWVCVPSRTLWVSLMNSPVRLGVSLAPATTPTGFFQSEVLRLYFLTLEPLFVWSVSLPSYFFQFIHTQIWDIQVHQLQPHPVLQPPPCCDSSRLGYLSLPLANGLDGCFFNSLVVGLHTVQFPGSSGYFLFLYLLFLFWLCKEAKYIYLHMNQTFQLLRITFYIS